MYTGTSGTVIADSGIKVASILTSGVVLSGVGGTWVSGSTTSTSGHLVGYTGTSGQVIADTGLGIPISTSGGGTGTSATPTAGQVPVGGAAGVYVPTQLTPGTGITMASTSGQIVITNSAAGAGWTFGTSLIASTDFNITPPSTATITMLTNQTAKIPLGSAMQGTNAGVAAYWAVISCTSSLITIRGPPLSTSSGALTTLSYGDATRVGQLTVSMPGYWDATSTNTYINSNTLMPNGYPWAISTCYLVGFNFITATPDSGGTSYVNVLWGTWTSGAVGMSGISTSNSGKGLAVSSGATLYQTGVDIPATQSIAQGQALDVMVTPSTSGDRKSTR